MDLALYFRDVSRFLMHFSALSVSFDSFFWNHLLWPEGEVLYFNAYLNRSHEWGTAPWHWYFTSALPRALGPALPLALISPFVARTRPVLIAPLAFVALYSFLPHKEVRFIFMAIPLFNTAAANVAARAWSSGKAMRAVLLAAAVAAAAMTAVGTIRAHYNYPGGDALMQLHSAHASQNGTRKGQCVCNLCTFLCVFLNVYVYECFVDVFWFPVLTFHRHSRPY